MGAIMFYGIGSGKLLHYCIILFQKFQICLISLFQLKNVNEYIHVYGDESDGILALNHDKSKLEMNMVDFVFAILPFRFIIERYRCDIELLLNNN